MTRHPWLPNLGSVGEMMSSIGISSLDQLFSDVPQSVRLKKPLNVAGKPLSEQEIVRRLEELERKNTQLVCPPFLGAGACPHYVPQAVKFVIGRSEFYTAYTPYQPEVSQGLLQAMFEYQSYMAELLEMEVVNSSLYDWGSALSEAVLMAHRVTGRRRVLVPETINPFHLQVLKTWTYGRGVVVERIPFDHRGLLSIEALEAELSKGEVAAVYVQQPNFLGVLEEELESVVELAKKHGALSIMGVNPLVLGVVRPPGEYGFDVAVGDGQELGLSLNYGGPMVGFFAVRWEGRLVRQMPGRIVGLTTDSEGRQSYALVLQTREQFTRREKATSNITTNEALMALANLVYLSLLGPNGLRELDEEIMSRSHYAARKLREVGASLPYSGEFFEEFLVRFPARYSKVKERIRSRGLHGGLQLDENSALFCVTEVHSKDNIDKMVEAVAEVM
ncbi:aminomethyl-transferring glycine dehydrogenase subunit GcvPA [Sulfodiicoccus acidiphilus]|uniref:aminomethyl-transferring glycine dehydrogenase subunit GcvPA n=1 Tax=Sulfodiicoccus acidiphilus TaxID=1670455 RepID=UPI000F84A622|nr:aminomethyl-transferring glycine dehydrogenase subunit GcvPA [Sulfodiicoccus acidiphilus]